MSFDSLDLNILKTLITNKKYAIDFVNDNDTALFSPEVWNFANIVVTHLKTYKELPTLRILTEKLAKGNNEKLISNLKIIWGELDRLYYDDKEFKHDLEKAKKRFAEKQLLSVKDNLVKLTPGSIDVNKTIADMQKTVQNIKSLHQTKTYERKTLKEAVPIFREEYNAKMEDPTFDAGIKSGYSYLDFATDGFRPGELVLVGAESGGGKCHAKGQKILKYDGTLIKVEDIKVGDLLMGIDSLPRTVLNINTGNDYMYDIVPTKGKSWRVNKDHILTCVKNGTNDLIDISVQEYLNLPSNSSNISKSNLKLKRVAINFNNKSKLLLDPYLLGVLIGDGSFCNTDITITNMDKEIIDYTKKMCIKYNLSCSVNSKGGTRAKQLRLAGTKGKQNIIAKHLEHYNLRFKTSKDKFVPFDYKTASRFNRLQMLAGLLDTDGHLSKNGIFDFISKSKQLSEDVCFIARSLGLAAYVKLTTKSCQNNFTRTYYRVCISGDLNIIPCKLLRKQAKKRKINKNVLNVGFSVRPTNNTETYYGFSLDGDSRYVLDDFTITHNSMLLMNMAIQMWLGTNVVDFNATEFAPANNVLYFSLEMPFKPCLNRVLSRLSGCPSKLIRNAKLSNDDAIKLKNVLKFINKYPNQFEIVDLPRNATMETLELIYEDAKATYDPKIIVIDYLGLMDYEGADMEDWLKLGKIAEKIHEFARVHNLIVLSAVQLNRAKGGKDAEEKIGLHRIGRSALIMQNANIAIQIETRPQEKGYPDMIYHLIKNRDGELLKGRLIKNLACGTLLDVAMDKESDTEFTLRDIDDISDKIDMLEE